MELGAEAPSAAQAIMIAPARKFSILLMPSSSILEQSNPTGTRGSLDAVIMWFLIVTGALYAGDASRPSSAREIPASAMHRPIKTRRLKKADFEVDFFFMELGLNSTLRHLNATARQVPRVLLSPPTTRQHNSFESMENLSKHRYRANKMDCDELRTTLSSETTLLLIRSRMMSIEIIPETSDLIDPNTSEISNTIFNAGALGENIVNNGDRHLAWT